MTVGRAASAASAEAANSNDGESKGDAHGRPPGSTPFAAAPPAVLHAAGRWPAPISPPPASASTTISPPAGRLPLAPEAANYLVNVLRLKPGARVLVFNGRDGEFAAALAVDGKRSARR